MKFLVVFCLLALAAADEDKLLDKKNQSLDTTQNTSSSLTQPLLNTQVFPQAAYFGTADPISNLAYTGFNGNVSPIQTVNPDFFATAAPAVVNGAIPTFPVTRAVLPGTSSVVTGIQSAFPVTGNVFPAVSGVPSGIAAIPSQFPAVGAGILSAVSGVQGTLDPNAATNNGVIQTVPSTGYRFLTADGYSGLPAQGLQAAQQVGLAAIPAFTSGILPSLGNAILQGQNIPNGLQQILKNPTPSNIPNASGLSTGNISGPLTNIFRHA